MTKAISDRLVVYIQYNDPLVEELYPNFAKRETVGWLTKETGGFVCIQNDRTLETSNSSHGSGKGTFIAISWIQEIRVLETGEKIDPGSLFYYNLS
jgi:hypothetical protein